MSKKLAICCAPINSKYCFRRRSVSFSRTAVPVSSKHLANIVNSGKEWQFLNLLVLFYLGAVKSRGGGGGGGSGYQNPRIL